MKNGRRAAAVIGLLAGALAAIGLMLRVGRHNKSIILLLMFAAWVLAPFVLLVWATMRSDRWPVLTQRTLSVLMLVVTGGTLAIYGIVAFGPPRPRPAAIFLLVPPISCVLISVALVTATQISRRSEP